MGIANHGFLRVRRLRVLQTEMGYEASSVPDDLPFHTHGYRTLPTDGPRDRIYGIGSEVLALEYHIYMTGMQLRAVCTCQSSSIPCGLFFVFPRHAMHSHIAAGIATRAD